MRWVIKFFFNKIGELRFLSRLWLDAEQLLGGHQAWRLAATVREAKFCLTAKGMLTIMTDRKW
jgi:hypothetical protein